MLVIVQIPIYDIRKFTPSRKDIVSRPNWKFLSDADVGNKFIRSIGPINRRLSGGNAIGENYYSKAKRAIRFAQTPHIQIIENGENRHINLFPRFRRFFFDGTNCGKYEIGFSVDRWKSKKITHTALEQFFQNLLACEVTIPIPYHSAVKTKLIDAGQQLAKQYLNATTYRKSLQNKKVTGVYGGSPCIYIETWYNEVVEHNFSINKVTLKNLTQLSISLFRLKSEKQIIKVWHGHIENNLASKIGREARISIMNLNVFRGSLHFALKRIEEGKLLPKPRSIESNELQEFIKECFGKYFKKIPKNLSDSDYEFLALQLEDAMSKGYRQKLEHNLKKVIQIRGNYFNQIRTYIDKMEHSVIKGSSKTIEIFIGDKVMGDKFENITNSTIVNKSKVENSFNKVKSEFDEETAAALKKVAELIDQSKNKDAGDIFNSFNEELSKPEPSKPVLKTFWEKLIKMVPVITTVAGVAEKIIKIFV